MLFTKYLLSTNTPQIHYPLPKGNAKGNADNQLLTKELGENHYPITHFLLITYSDENKKKNKNKCSYI